MSIVVGAFIPEVVAKLAAGWTFEVSGNCLIGTGGEPSGTISIGCGTEEGAQALLEAATETAEATG